MGIESVNQTPVIIAALALAGSVVASLFTYRASNAANKISATKVDAEAYERATAFYKQLLETADRELTRIRGQLDQLHGQLDRVSTQLSQEQDASTVLRNQIRILHMQVAALEATVESLRALVPPGLRPPSPVLPKLTEEDL